MCSRRTAGYGCGCARRAASGTRCRAITTSRNTCIAYLDGVGLRDDPKGPLFRTIGRGTGQLTRTALPQANAYAMIRRRAAAAGIETKTRQSQLPRDGDHGLSQERRHAGKGRCDGKPCLHAYDAALRSSARRGEPR